MFRRLIALLCLLAIVLALLAPGPYGLAPALLAPFWLFIAILTVVSVQRATEDCDAYAFPFASTIPARAPPIQ